MTVLKLMLELLKKNRAQIITIFVSVSIAFFVEQKIGNPFDDGQFIVMAAIYSALGLISLKLGLGFNVKKDSKDQ